MIDVSPELRAALNAVENRPVDLYELYLDAGTVYLADQAVTWGGHNYLAKVKSRSSIKRYMGGQFDAVTVTLSNVDLSIAAALLPDNVEGRRLVIRKIDLSVADSSVVIFDGPMDRPGAITETEASLSAKHILGSIDFDAPARTFSPDQCVWDFKSTQCGYAGGETECNKSWARCTELAQTARFGAFRFVPHSGIYQYQTTETKRFLLLFRRKKTTTTYASFSAVDDTPYDVPIPIIYGRAMLAGIPIEHADEGGVTKVLSAFGIGKVSDFLYVRANEAGVLDYTKHYGAFGGGADQGVDPRFPGSYPYSQVAYLGVTVPSDVREVDPAPNVTAVVLGRGVAVFDEDGAFVSEQWSDNPVWCARDFMTLPLAEGGMGIPEALMDDVVAAETAAYCAGIIEDRTGSQKIFSPASVPDDIDYKRFQSTGVDGGSPDVDGPYSDFEAGVDDDTSVTPEVIDVRRFTLNGAIARQEKAVDILYEKILPAFRGYLTQSAEGKIQIRCERPVVNTALTAAASATDLAVVCDETGWEAGDLALLSPFTASAEVRRVSEVVSGGLWFEDELEHNHLDGAVVMKVAMAFDDSSIVGQVEYPLGDRQSSTNRVTVKYTNAPAGFVEQELHVNDYDHQAKVHKVNGEDVDGGLIDSFFQAWRIGQFRRAKARDLGKWVSLRGDIKATLLEVGDVIAVAAEESGLQAVPFLVEELELGEDDEVGIIGRLYSLDAYSDTAPQATVTVPAIFPSPTGRPGVAAAPNVLAATPAFTAGQVGGRPVLIPSAVVTLPVDDPDYARLRRLHVRIHAPDTVFAGTAAKLTVEGPFEPDGSDQITVTLPPILQDTKARTYDWTFSVENEDGKVSPGALQVANVAAPAAAGPDVPPANVASVTGDEVAGSRYPAPGTRLVRAKFQATVTFAADQGVQTFLLWLSKDDGAHWQGIDWYPASGTTGGATIDQAVPADDQTWKFAAQQGRVPFDASVLVDDGDLPAGAVRQVTGFTVDGLAAPGVGLVDELVVPAGTGPSDFPYLRGPDPDNGYQDWCLPSISMDVSDAVADADARFATLVVRDLDGDGDPIGDWHRLGVMALGDTPGMREWGRLAGPYGDVADPPRSGSIGKVELKLVLSSGKSEAQDAWDDPAVSTDQCSLVVEVAVGGALPDGSIPATRLDPLTLGRGVTKDGGTGLLILNTGDLSNMALNPAFEQGLADWTDYDPAYVTASGTAMTGSGSARMQTPDAVTSKFLYSAKSSCRPGDVYYAECWGATSGAGTDGGYSFGVQFLDAAGAQVGAPVYAVEYGPLVAWPHATVAPLATAPAGSSFVRVFIGLGYGHDPASGAYFIDNVVLRRQVSTGDGTEPDGAGGVKAKVSGGLQLAGGAIVVQVGDGIEVAAGAVKAKLGNGLTTSAGAVVVNLGGGLSFSGAALQVATGNGLTLSGGAVVANLGNGLTISGGAIAANLGNGLTVSGGAIAVNLGSGLGLSGGAVAVQLGNGLSISGGAVQVSLGNGLTISGGSVIANLGNGLTTSAGAVVVSLGNGMTFSGTAVAVNAGTGLTVGITLAIANGGVGPTQISSVDISQLNAGTMNVGAGGVTFSGAGGILMTSGGNVAVTPGYVIAQAMKTYFGGDYQVNGTTVIDASRNFSGVAATFSSVCTASRFDPTGNTGATHAVKIRDSLGNDCSLIVNGSNLGAVRFNFVGGAYVGTTA